MRLRTVFTAERLWFALIVVFGLGGIVTIGRFLAARTEARGEKANQSDVQLANGDPSWNTVNVYHDQKRGVTCYVETNHGGIACFLDITIEQEADMRAYRDGGR
mgnify:CR=1 FL=1